MNTYTWPVRPGIEWDDQRTKEPDENMVCDGLTHDTAWVLKLCRAAPDQIWVPSIDNLRQVSTRVSSAPIRGGTGRLQYIALSRGDTQHDDVVDDAADQRAHKLHGEGASGGQFRVLSELEVGQEEERLAH